MLHVDVHLFTACFFHRSPELTVDTTEGINATYRLVYEAPTEDNQWEWDTRWYTPDFSVPGNLTFSISHPTASRPVIYVELAPGRYPERLVSAAVACCFERCKPCLRRHVCDAHHLYAQSRILLQRVEGDATWVAASIPATSPVVTSNQRSLVIWDNTTRATHWGERTRP